MSITVEEFKERLGQVAENIQAEIANKESELIQKTFRILEENEKEIFENEHGPGMEEWPRISALTFITRKDPPEGATYTSVEQLITDTRTAKPLVDKGSLFRSVTERTDESIRETEEGGSGFVIRFGTSHEAAKKLQEGGKGSGFDIRHITRARIRTEGPAEKFVMASLMNREGPGDIPARKFLYISENTPDAIEEVWSRRIRDIVEATVLGDRN